MADYIYTLETRLSPDQQKAVALVLDAAKSAGMNLYLTGGAIRDIITGFPIRDLDFTVQGNALKLQKDLERAGAVIGGDLDAAVDGAGVDDDDLIDHRAQRLQAGCQHPLLVADDQGRGQRDGRDRHATPVHGSKADPQA